MHISMQPLTQFWSAFYSITEESKMHVCGIFSRRRGHGNEKAHKTVTGSKTMNSCATKKDISQECRRRDSIKLHRKHSHSCCLQEFPPVTQLWVRKPVVFITFQEPHKDLLVCMSSTIRPVFFFFLKKCGFVRARFDTLLPIIPLSFTILQWN